MRYRLGVPESVPQPAWPKHGPGGWESGTRVSAGVVAVVAFPVEACLLGCVSSLRLSESPLNEDTGHAGLGPTPDDLLLNVITLLTALSTVAL